jgi:hypothetical protein
MELKVSIDFGHVKHHLGSYIEFCAFQLLSHMKRYTWRNFIYHSIENLIFSQSEEFGEKVKNTIQPGANSVNSGCHLLGVQAAVTLFYGDAEFFQS